MDGQAGAGGEHWVDLGLLPECRKWDGAKLGEHVRPTIAKRQHLLSRSFPHQCARGNFMPESGPFWQSLTGLCCHVVFSTGCCGILFS